MPLRANYSFSKVAAEAVCTWVAKQYSIPLTIIRICSTYGPEGGAPADRLEMMLAHKPIRLHPDKPNNYNPIYEDDYVELGIRAMEVAATPPIVVNWAGSETVSVEDYCTYMGELVGVEPIFEYTPDAHTPLWPDVTYMHEILGATKVPWREGFRRMIAARHPEIALPQDDSRSRRTNVMELPGTPSDEVDGVLADGRGRHHHAVRVHGDAPSRGRRRRISALAHPRPPARAAPAVRRARLAAVGVDAGVPGRARSEPRPLSTRSTT